MHTVKIDTRDSSCSCLGKRQALIVYVLSCHLVMAGKRVEIELNKEASDLEIPIIFII